MGLLGIQDHRAIEQGANLRAPTPPGSAIVYSLKASIWLELVDAEVTLRCEHGEANQKPSVHSLASIGDRLQLSWSSSFLEQYHEPRGDPVHRFDRHWNTLELAFARYSEAVIGPKDFLSRSPIEGHTVQFFPGDEIGQYDARWKGDGTSPPRELLADLQPELPSIVILSERPSSDERTWTVDPSRLIRSLWTGGFVDLGYGERGASTGDWPSVHIAIVPELPPRPEVWMNNITGTVQAASTDRQVNGIDNHAAIDLEFDVKSSNRAEKWVPDLLRKAGVDGDYVDMLGYRGHGVSWHLKGNGEVLWMQPDGSLRSMRIAGELSVRYDLSWSYKWDSPAIEEFVGDFFQEWRGQVLMTLTASDGVEKR